MLIVGITTAVLVIGSLVLLRVHAGPLAANRLLGVSLVSAVVAFTVTFGGGTAAHAAIVPTIQLGTSSNYAVLAASTVTNTGASVLNGSLGLSPLTSVTGFPPGIVVPPGTTDIANGAALQAQSDLTAAYIDADGRPINANTPADLTDLVLVGGVYAGPGPGNGALELTGPLVLDGQNNPDSVFIFQTDSTLITASGSTVSLINGAQACNVFWQVGSSATLGENSVFVGNILALTSVTVGSNVVVEGRAMARNAAVTLINDTFTAPECAQVSPTTTTTRPLLGATTSTPGGGIDTPTAGGTATTLLGTGETGGSGGATSTTTGGISSATPTGFNAPTTGVVDSVSGRLPRTGSDISIVLLLAISAVTIGAAALGARRAALRT